MEWARGYGVLKAGGDEPVITETLFHAGSIAKPVSTASDRHRKRRPSAIHLSSVVRPSSFVRNYAVYLVLERILRRPIALNKPLARRTAG